MESLRHETKLKRVKSIIKDLYYRVTSLPLILLFWALIIIWRKRIQKRHDSLTKSRLMLEEIWLQSSRLEGDKYNLQQKKLRKFEKDFLGLEKNLAKDEEMFLKREEQFKYYLKKVFDPNLGS